MFFIDKAQNRALSLEKKTFSALRLQERNHLQEWIANNTEILGREEELLAEFLGGEDLEEVQINQGDQRIILVAANFRKEVTSTVMWLLAHGVNIRCVKVTPYQYGGDVLLDTEQVLPTPDTEALQIKLSSKRQEERLASEAQSARSAQILAFWRAALPKLREISGMFDNRSATRYHWIGTPSGVPGCKYVCSATMEHVQAELYIDFGKGRDGQNKHVFDRLYARREEVENSYGRRLTWERLDNRRASRVMERCHTFSLEDQDTWPEAIETAAESIARLRAALAAPLLDITGAMEAEPEEAQGDFLS